MRTAGEEPRRAIDRLASCATEDTLPIELGALADDGQSTIIQIRRLLLAMLRNFRCRRRPRGDVELHSPDARGRILNALAPHR
jgi:hypothetical protein